MNIPFDYFDGTAQNPRLRSPTRLWLSIILLGEVGVGGGGAPGEGLAPLLGGGGGGGGGGPREGLASLLGRGSNGVKVLYTLLRDCGVFIFNLLYYSKNAAPLRAGGLAL